MILIINNGTLEVNKNDKTSRFFIFIDLILEVILAIICFTFICISFFIIIVSTGYFYNKDKIGGIK